MVGKSTWGSGDTGRNRNEIKPARTNPRVRRVVATGRFIKGEEMLIKYHEKDVRLWRSVKHEDVYLNGYVDMLELQLGLTDYCEFYNTERPHQSLGNLTSAQVYSTANGGGARIVDKFIERKTTLKTGAAPASS